MRSLGISINPAGKQTRLTGAIVSGTLVEPVLEDEFSLSAADSDPTEQAVEVAQLLLAKLPGLDFEVAAVRIAGASPFGRRNKAQFTRAHAEGAAIYVLRHHAGNPVLIGDPNFFAKILQLSKDDAVMAAKSLSASKHDAVLAALGSLPRS